MDAREALVQVYVSHHTSKNEWADNVIARLRRLGFTIIHRDENHGPTLERARGIIEQNDEGFSTKTGCRVLIPRTHGSVSGLGYVEAIRAMEVKHHG